MLERTLETIDKAVEKTDREYSVAAMSYPFTAAPEYLVPVTPEEKRTTAQKVVASSADIVVGLTMRSALIGWNPMPVEAAVVTAATAMGVKALALEDKENGKKKELDIHEVASTVGKSTAEGVVMTAAVEKGYEIAGSWARNKGIGAIGHLTEGMATLPFIAAAAAAPITHNARLNDPQVDAKDETFMQKAGHIVVNGVIDTGVAVAAIGALTLSPAIIAGGLFGVGWGIVTNTIIGRDRSKCKTSNDDAEESSVRTLRA